ncbi:hypothetical protein RJT34_23108 [Clitoria ternatea]|uniref:Pentatricopeptide repeat-containing protein n=1 Tax=Clitoria ternatea TaxID=43366 RepID=A0AAN9FS70_CLITE
MSLHSYLLSRLVLLGKPGIKSAFKLFWALAEKNIVSWNSMVAVWTQNGIPDEASNYFNMMRVSGLLPDGATMVSLLQACEKLPVGRLPDKVALTAMLAGYAMHGRGREAIEFFERTVRDGTPPTISGVVFILYGAKFVLSGAHSSSTV